GGDALLPEERAVLVAQAEEHTLLAVLAVGLEVDVVFPEDRRRMAGRQLDFPEYGLGSELDRDGLVVGDAGAVGTAEAGPIGGGCDGSGEGKQAKAGGAEEQRSAVRHWWDPRVSRHKATRRLSQKPSANQGTGPTAFSWALPPPGLQSSGS